MRQSLSMLQDPERREQAELMFAKLKKSYEVLSDPHKRAIYDCLGKAGLQVGSIDIIFCWPFNEIH